MGLEKDVRGELSNGISDMWGVLTKSGARARVCPIKTICILPLSSVQTSLSFPIFHFSELFFISIIRSSRAHTSHPAPAAAASPSPLLSFLPSIRPGVVAIVCALLLFFLFWHSSFFQFHVFLPLIPNPGRQMITFFFSLDQYLHVVFGIDRFVVIALLGATFRRRPQTTMIFFSFCTGLKLFLRSLIKPLYFMGRLIADLEWFLFRLCIP